MATTSTLLSWAAFEQLPDDGMHHEIIEGVLVTLPPPRHGHNKLAHHIFRLLDPVVSPGYELYLEEGYKLTEKPATWIRPDVSMVRRDRDLAADLDGYITGAPDLALEIISPSESATDVEAKIELLLKHGGREVWVFYTRSQKVMIRRADRTAVTLGIGDTLTFDLLPGWSLPVAKLFDFSL